MRSQLKHEKEVNENRLKALAAANEVATAPEVEEPPVVAQAEEVQAEEAPAVEVQAEEAPVAQAEETPAVEAPAADAAAEESTEA